MSEMKLEKELVERTLGIFKGLKAACPENDLTEFQLWMMHHIHQMWQRKEINGDQVALLLDETCCW